jgi:zinc transport system permease protein
MQSALLAVILITPILGLIGTMVVHNKMAYFSDALSHCLLTGAALGMIVNFENSIISTLIFSVIFAIGISWILESEKSSVDTVIGVFSSAGFALGVVLLSFGGGFEKLSGFLIGDILSVSYKEIKIIAILFIIVILFWFLLFNKIIIADLNSDLATSKQINVKIYKKSFFILIALIVAISVKLVGTLIINSLLTLPAAAARNIARGLREYHILTVFFSLISGVMGLIISFYMGTSAGAIIVLFAVFIFIFTFILNHLRK